jgi:hypothetical protein
LPTDLLTPRVNRNCLDQVRREMMSPGFTIVKVPLCFDERALAQLQGRRTVLPLRDRRWRRFPDLVRYAHWLEDLLARALPDEAVAFVNLEFRREPDGSVDADVDRLHADGSYVRSVYALYGPATIYRHDGVERPVPAGKTLLMTAMDRARATGVPCTLHRRPGAGPERAVIVCSFAPQTQPSTSPYREALQALARARMPCGGPHRAQAG